MPATAYHLPDPRHSLRPTKANIPSRFFFPLLFLLLSGCMPKANTLGLPAVPAQLLANRYLTADGSILPIRQWPPQKSTTIQAVLIAIHGFNDYSNSFQQPAEFFSRQGIACYAYDQRGFGNAPQRGLWAGTPTYVQDLTLFIRLIRNKHPHLPIFLLGESMGGAVVVATMAQTPRPDVAGIILSAPAVWARNTMPWYQQALLWSLAHTLPSLRLTGRGLKIQASDNIPMLKALSRDPLVIKATRVEALWGLADLMDIAQRQAGQLNLPGLLLYGDNDQIIPPQPTYQFLSKFLQTRPPQKSVAFYKNGYHMLLRDINAFIVWQDILAWIKSPATALPSAADRYAKQRLDVDGKPSAKI
ncbi:MAG: lysophospholipase [Methylovulum miyakonense]|uniref:alpha/beta hydrolase n=1 Tax=Methylovulum miyakonense TaxID=645578 RepID=UPI003BB6E6C3